MKVFRRNATYTGLAAAAVGILLTACASLPDVASTPRPSTQADAIARNLDCMRDRGWEPIVYDDGLGYEGPSEQAKAFGQDARACNDLVGPAMRELDEDEYETAFTAQNEVLNCLRDYGLELPDAPSFQAYVDNKAGWSPYLYVDPGMSAAEFEDVEASCPQATLW